MSKQERFMLIPNRVWVYWCALGHVVRKYISRFCVWTLLLVIANTAEQHGMAVER